jgi:hypothetical protein
MHKSGNGRMGMRGVIDEPLPPVEPSAEVLRSGGLGGTQTDFPELDSAEWKDPQTDPVLQADPYVKRIVSDVLNYNTCAWRYRNQIWKIQGIQIVNASHLLHKFESKRNEFVKKGIPTTEELIYFGGKAPHEYFPCMTLISAFSTLDLRCTARGT